WQLRAIPDADHPDDPPNDSVDEAIRCDDDFTVRQIRNSGMGRPDRGKRSSWRSFVSARRRKARAASGLSRRKTRLRQGRPAEPVALFDAPGSRYPYSADGSFPLTGEVGIVEPFVAIAFAAALTTRIRLGTGICLVPQRPPLYTAKQVADADVLSGGRLDFGVGIGWLREEFEALGVPFAGRAARCREYLAA